MGKPVDFQLFGWSVKGIDASNIFVTIENLNTGDQWLSRYDGYGTKPVLTQCSNHVTLPKDVRDKLALKMFQVINYHKGEQDDTQGF